MELGSPAFNHTHTGEGAHSGLDARAWEEFNDVNAEQQNNNN